MWGSRMLSRQYLYTPADFLLSSYYLSHPTSLYITAPSTINFISQLDLGLWLIFFFHVDLCLNSGLINI